MRTIESEALGARAREVIDGVRKDGEEVVVTVAGGPSAVITRIAPPVSREAAKGPLSDAERKQLDDDLAEIESIATYVTEGWIGPLSFSEAVIAQRR